MDQDQVYPDVTLADQVAMEHHALNAQAQSEEKAGGKETLVVLQPRSTRYHLTRANIIIVVFIAVIVLFASILASIFITRKLDSNQCIQCNASSQTQVSLEDLDSNSTVKGNGSIEDTPDGVDKIPIEELPGMPWSEIRLPLSLKPVFYDIKLQVDVSELRFNGSLNISFTVEKSTKYIVFHVFESVLKIDKSSVSVRSKLSPERQIISQFSVKKRQFHVIELNREMEVSNDNYILTIGNFSGQIVNNLRGLYSSSYTNKEGNIEYIVVSQLQAIDARRVIPCFDEPNMKASFKVTIVHQQEFTALANMPVISQTALTSGWMQSDFDTTPVMSTYLLAFVVGRIKSRGKTLTNIKNQERKEYELKIWARPDAYTQTEYALDFGAKAYYFFTNYFDLPDVVPKSDHMAVPDFGSGAMENWGLVIYRETALLYDKMASSSLNKFMVTLIVAHEIAHTWFGNMATMAWWNDLWLNEGFASLLMYICMDHVYPDWNVFAIRLVDDIFPVMVRDALSTSHALSVKVDLDPMRITEFFDEISYNKGEAVLRMFMEFTGKDNFRDGLRSYVRTFRYRNADISQLWSVFHKSLDYEVAKIMNTWTLQMGYPMVTVKDEGNHFRLTQTRFLLDRNEVQENVSQEENSFGYKWYIPFTYVTEEDQSHVKQVWLNQTDADIPKPSSGWILGNHDYVGFYRVMYSTDMWHRLSAQLLSDHAVMPEANRAGLIGDSFMFARAGLADYGVALNLSRYLKKEQSYVPWKAFLQSIEFLRAMISRKAAYVHLQHYLKGLVTPIYQNSTSTGKGTLPEKYLRSLILYLSCDLGIEAAVEYAKSMFKNWMRHGHTISADLAVLIYSVGVREGGAAEWDYVWNKTKATSVASESEMMMESLVHTQKPWLLHRYIEWIFDEKKVRRQNVRLVMGHFSKTPLAQMVALNFFLSRWKELLHEFGHDAFMMKDIILQVTQFVNTEYHLDQLKTLFEKNPPKTVPDSVDNAVALIKSNIGWMNANYKNIADWLKAYELQ